MRVAAPPALISVEVPPAAAAVAPCQVNAELKKFGHINRKALDQYMNFTEQRDQLYRRKEVRRPLMPSQPCRSSFLPRSFASRCAAAAAALLLSTTWRPRECP